MSNVVEFTSFKLQKEVSLPDFLLASDKLQIDFIAMQNGYISRKLILNDEKWADLVVWETMDDARNAVTEWDRNAAANEYMSFIDGKSINMTYFSVEVNY